MPEESPANPDTTLALPAKEVNRGAYVDTFTVNDHGKKYEVAANAIANRALMQINVAKLRTLCERAMKVYEDHPDAPVFSKDLKIIADAVEVVENLSERAYSDGKNGGPMGSAIERLVYAATKGAAAGAAKPVGSNSPEARLKRLKQIGRAKSVQQIEPAPKVCDDEFIEVDGK
jgi:hypothetical protein